MKTVVIGNPLNNGSFFLEPGKEYIVRKSKDSTKLEVLVKGTQEQKRVWSEFDKKDLDG